MNPTATERPPCRLKPPSVHLETTPSTEPSSCAPARYSIASRQTLVRCLCIDVPTSSCDLASAPMAVSTCCREYVKHARSKEGPLLAEHAACRGQRAEYLAGSVGRLRAQVPESERGVAAPACQLAPVRAEGRRQHRLRVPCAAPSHQSMMVDNQPAMTGLVNSQTPSADAASLVHTHGHTHGHSWHGAWPWP